MPIYHATSSAESRLVETSESGMGFQILRYRGELIVALNATVLVPLRDLIEARANADELVALLARSETDLESDASEPFDLHDDFTLAFSQLELQLNSIETGLNIPKIAAAPPENVISPKRAYSYYRFSAAHRDKRIMPNGDFVPGTYATTYADFHFVPSGFAAVGRYALPNPASARFVFQIVTLDRPTLMGTATPNFGQAGGGVEVLFANGAKNTPSGSFRIDAG
jgi:hypothetical protein